MKEIKDYLHLYLGCEIINTNEDGTIWFKGILTADTLNLILKGRLNMSKMLLRPLSSMTDKDEEATGLNAAYEFAHYTFTPSEFLYFLSHGFDLFGLIEAGLAIDVTTLNQPASNTGIK
jgi:hypothetical protein